MIASIVSDTVATTASATAPATFLTISSLTTGLKVKFAHAIADPTGSSAILLPTEMASSTTADGISIIPLAAPRSESAIPRATFLPPFSAFAVLICWIVS
jgi:hypothetical protein